MASFELGINEDIARIARDLAEGDDVARLKAAQFMSGHTQFCALFRLCVAAAEASASLEPSVESAPEWNRLFQNARLSVTALEVMAVAPDPRLRRAALRPLRRLRGESALDDHELAFESIKPLLWAMLCILGAVGVGLYAFEQSIGLPMIVGLMTPLIFIGFAYDRTRRASRRLRERST